MAFWVQVMKWTGDSGWNPQSACASFR